jgi:hypothetical protein
MSVPRIDLLDKINARIAEVEAQFEESDRVKDMREAIRLHRDGENQEEFTRRLQEWHSEIGEGLADGRFKLTASGRLANDAPRKPSRGKSNRYWDWSLDQLEQQLQQYEGYFQGDLQPLRAARDLLEMSNDERVQISPADYQKLLSHRRNY